MLISKQHLVRRGVTAALVVVAPALTACGRTVCAPDHAHDNEMAAIRTLHNLNTAQVQYRSAYGRYAGTLAELGPPDGGIGASATRADLIPAALALGTRAGYNFTLSSADAGDAIHADPQRYGVTGRRSFYTAPSGVIRERRGNEGATARDPEVK